MKKIKRDIFKPLDKYEKELLRAIENDELVDVPNQEKEIRRYTSYFKHTFKKDKRVTIRVPKNDLDKIQKKAIETGIPYQTLIASILRKFARGKINIGV